tara:strand:- start:236 stop:685 length:450 start_codon:yes stop_codon:yes gene_type:complete
VAPHLEGSRASFEYYVIFDDIGPINRIKTFMLMAPLTAIFLVGGFILGGETGAIIAFGFALVTTGITYWNSDRMVLAIHGARQVDKQSTPQLYGLVEQLAYRAAVPMPKVFIIDTPQPNAFARGAILRMPRSRRPQASWRCSAPKRSLA